MKLEDMLTGCRAGRAEAQAALVTRFSPGALRLASALLDGDAAAAEDAVQAAWVAALERLDTLRAPAAFPAWFRQIVRTHCGRIRRRRRPGEALHTAPEAALATGHHPGERLHREALRARVRAAIERLPPVSRETTALYYLEQRTQAEVASALGLPVGTVKRRLHDARHRLRDLLLAVDEPAGASADPDARAALLPW